MSEGLLDTETSSDATHVPASLPRSLPAQAGVATNASEMKHGSAQAGAADPRNRLPESRASKTEPVPVASSPPAHASELADRHSYLSVDRAFKAHLGRLTFGLSPNVLAEQTFDWLCHLGFSPGKQLQLIESCLRGAARLGLYAAQKLTNPDLAPCVAPLPNDRRFQAQAWQTWPYNLLYQNFLLTEQWWQNATTGVDGVSRRNEERLSFTVRQLLDVMSPSNFVWTNPEVAKATLEHGGQNLVAGFQNLVEDWKRLTNGQPPVGAEKFVVGKNVAVTPGKVVFQNRLIELIQYAPSTDQVYAEPVLMVPAWIMKYYILDLSPQNSLVKYLVDRGHTVFMISWKNPTSEDRDLGMDDYRRLGVMAAVDAISAIVPDRKIHAAGYCLGGTLLMLAAAGMGHAGDDRLASITLFAAQTDFTEAGELMLFLAESQVSLLENMMWDRGYLDSDQMSGAFQILRSNDLVWSRLIREYLLGEPQPMNDLMAWNADATRMPYRMHSEYLRRLFLNNDFIQGRFTVDGHPVWVTDIAVPGFVVGTVADHVAPWRSVYKSHLLPRNEVTFVLASGGHNAGIVSEPGHPRRKYQIRTRVPGQPYVDPDTWQAEAPVRQGSWWTEWQPWLARRSSGKVAPPTLGAPDRGYAPRRDAPGLYVRER